MVTLSIRFMVCESAATRRLAFQGKARQFGLCPAPAYRSDMGRIIAVVLGVLLALTVASTALSLLRVFVLIGVVAVVVVVVIRLIGGRSGKSG